MPSASDTAIHPSVGPRRRLDGVVSVVLAVALAASFVLINLSQRDDRRRFEGRLLTSAAGDADFTATAVTDLARRQATAGRAALAGEVDSGALAAVAAQLGVDFALLFGPGGDLLAVHPEREVDGPALIAQFAHLRRALDGQTGVSATLSAPSMESGVAIAVAAPFEGSDGRRVLSTAFDRTSTLLDRYLASARITPSAAAWLIDDEGGIVAHGADPGPPPVDRPEPDRVAVTELRGTSVAVVVAPVPGTPWSVVVAAPTSEIFASVQGLALWLPRLLLGLLFLAFVVQALLLRRNREVSNQLTRVNAEVEAAADRTREFVAVAAHELRTPTSVILGYSSRLSRHWRELGPAELDDHIGRLASASRRLADLLAQLLTQATADRGQIAASTTDVFVLEAVRTAIDDAGCNHLDVHVDVPRGTVVHADRTYVGRILVNLLENATKYGRPPVLVAARPVADGVAISVRDHGPGVPASFRPHLFERFARGSVAAGGNDEGGAGLGLSVARGIAAEMGGSLDHEDADPGARFVLVLPAGRAPDALPDDPADEALTDAAPARG